MPRYVTSRRPASRTAQGATMMKPLLVLLAVLAACGGGWWLWSRSTAHAAPPNQAEAAADPALRFVCRHCRKTFTPAEAKPAPGAESLLLCPHCGKPTPRAAARTH